MADGRGEVLWLQNRHSSPLHLTAVTLEDCENVLGGCQPRIPLGLRLDVGGTYQVMEVLAADASRPLSFSWRVHTRVPPRESPLQQ
jgi:hypothetical protein